MDRDIMPCKDSIDRTVRKERYNRKITRLLVYARMEYRAGIQDIASKQGRYLDRDVLL